MRDEFKDTDAPSNPALIKRCLRCGRRLTGEEARERGYGKVCWKKHLMDKQSMLF